MQARTQAVEKAGLLLGGGGRGAFAPLKVLPPLSQPVDRPSLYTATCVFLLPPPPPPPHTHTQRFLVCAICPTRGLGACSPGKFWISRPTEIVSDDFGVIKSLQMLTILD